ncbi:unnamed protein product [Linum tenue]|nr:unnamed protein product [Linum tenue]
MPDEEVGRRFFVCDSFNDLVLCGFTDPGFRNNELGRTYIVCNPFTKQWVALPLAPKKRPGYDPSVAKLVLKPLISPDLDLGDGQVFAYSSKYQFRVVVLYRYRGSLRLDVFCSESGEWRKEVVVHDGVYGLFDGKLAYYNGALFLATGKEHAGRAGVFLVSLDPFRLDMPLTHYVDASTILIAHKTAWNIIVSQGALHLLAIKYGTPGCLTVWRLEEGCKSWRKQYELLANAPIRGKFEFDKFFPGYLHPDKPEIVFLEYRDPREERSGIYSFDLSRMAGGEDIEFFAGFRRGIPRWKMVKSRVPCWPTQIPRYEELRDMYDGSYSCWVQNNEATTLSIFGNCFCS